MEKQIEFTQADAQMMIDLASAAPLQNLAAARQATLLLEKFRDWYMSISAPPPKVAPNVDAK